MFGKKKDEEEKKVETPVEETKPASDEPKVEAEKAEGRSDAEQPGAADGHGESVDAGEAGAGGAPEKPAEPDWKTLYAVTLADFDNYKKRAARDREDVYRYAESDILKDVLPTVDNLALALKSVEDAASPFAKGVQLVYDSLLKALADHGAKPMDDLLGKDLDPNLHEAIAQLPSADVEEGKISNVVKNGWLLNDKLLRAAQVVVSAGKSS